MVEKDFQTLFTKWIRKHSEAHSITCTTAFELKITKQTSISFARVEGHQITALLQAKHGCLYHKISDQSLGYKPFDAFQICYSPAYVVILFYKPRAKKVMYWIDIDMFLAERDNSTRKSLTEARAQEISSHIFPL